MADIVFSKIEEEVKSLLVVLREASKQIDDLVKASTKDIKFGNSQEVDELAKKIRDLEKALKDKELTQKQILALEKEEQKLAQERERTTQGEIRTQKLQNTLNEQERKIRENLNKERNKELTAFQKLSRERTKAQNDLKNSIVLYGEQSKQVKEATRRFNELDNAQRRINTLAKDGRVDVGRYGIALAGVGKNLIGAFGVVGGLQMFASILKGSFNIVKNFSSAQSELASILGVTKKELGDLTDVTLALGSSTAFTATEVTKAATELAKLGFTTTEIKQSLKGVLDGAIAMGVGIDESAGLTAKALRSFGLEASESERVVSTLAVATTKTGLNFQYLADSLPYAATSAKQAGFTIEQLTAMLGQLADNGLKASTAGTGLRDIFSDLSKAGLTLDEALDKIENSTDKTRTATDLFGKTSASVAIILQENRGNFDKLTDSISDQKEALDRLVETRLDNLEGDVKLLTSAWEGFVLSIESGGGSISNVFRGIVQVATGFLTVLEKLNRGAKDYSDGIREEITVLKESQTELNNRLRVLKSSNLTEEQRAKLVKETNEKFSDFLPTLITTKDTEEQLSAIQKASNNELIRRIILKTREAEITEILNEIAENRIKLFEAEEKLESARLRKDTRQIGNQLRFIRNLKASNELLESQLNLEDENTRKIIERFSLKQGESILDEKDIETTTKKVQLTEEQIEKQKELTGLIEKQRKVVNDISKQYEEADSENKIIALKKELIEARKELDRLNNLSDEFNPPSFDISGGDTQSLSGDFTYKKSFSEIIKDNEELAKASEKILSASLDKLNEISKNRSEERIKQLEKENDTARQGYANLEEAAIKGNTDASERLELEKQQERARTQLIEEEKEKQMKVEFALASIKLLSANASQGNAVPKTIAEMGDFISTIISSLPSFDKGTEFLNVDGKGVDGKKGTPIIAHHGEGILPEKVNAKRKGLSNEKLGDVAQSYIRGELISKNAIVPLQVVNREEKQSRDNLELIKEVRTLNESIKGLKQNPNFIDFETIGNIIKVEQKQRVGNEIKIKKTKFG